MTSFNLIPICCSSQHFLWYKYCTIPSKKTLLFKTLIIYLSYSSNTNRFSRYSSLFLCRWLLWDKHFFSTSWQFLINHLIFSFFFFLTNNTNLNFNYVELPRLKWQFGAGLDQVRNNIDCQQNILEERGHLSEYRFTVRQDIYI